MVSKNTIKLIKSLALKKIRIKENLFLVEGDKNVSEVLTSGFYVEKLLATSSFLANNSSFTNQIKHVEEVSELDIKQASLLKNPQNSIAICAIPETKELPEMLNADLSIFLDDIQDPGNLGTIIRICDWFGVTELFCSPKTADIYNPKVIQASMGSFCRVEVWYSPFESIASLAKKSEMTVLGAFLDGENIYSQELPEKIMLVMGNEGNGISSTIENVTEFKIKIPEFSHNKVSAESLNVSVATAIICAEIKRQNNFTSYSK